MDKENVGYIHNTHNYFPVTEVTILDRRNLRKKGLIFLIIFQRPSNYHGREHVGKHLESW